MTKTKFVVSGKARLGDRSHDYNKIVDAKDENEAREHTYSLFGSEHGVKRRWMTIDKVEKAKAKS
jgi:large subunit ribosomal protein LX